MSGIHGIVAYSVFQMPEDDNNRIKLFKKVLKKKKIFFACENLKISDFKEIDRVENIWKIKKISEKCIKPEDLKIMRKNYISKLHTSTKRDYLKRMVDNKVFCMSQEKNMERNIGMEVEGLLWWLQIYSRKMEKCRKRNLSAIII